MPAAANWNGNPAVGTIVNKWHFVGCQSEINGRLLRGASTSGGAMTIETCQAFCAKENFGLAGLEYGQECYCANALSRGNTLSNPPACTMACKGAAGQKCGGSNALSVFNNTAYVPPSPGTKVAGWSYASCYMEPQYGRALPDKLWSDPAMTVAKCTSFCAAAGLPWAGLEWSTECWCGKALAVGLQDASDPGCAMQCNMACGGASREVCGGAGAVSVYKVGAAPAKAAGKGMVRRGERKAADGVDGVFMRNGRFVQVKREEKGHGEGKHHHH